MRYLHTMLRVRDLDAALDFYCNKLGLKETRRRVDEKNRYTLVFVAAPGDEKLVEDGKKSAGQGWRSNSPTTGIPRTMVKLVFLGTWPMRSMTFTRLATA